MVRGKVSQQPAEDRGFTPATAQFPPTILLAAVVENLLSAALNIN